MQHPHARQARLAHLRRADEVEVGVGLAAHRCLRVLGNAKAAAPMRRPVAAEVHASILAVSKVGAQRRMSDQCVGPEIGFALRNPVDQRP